MYTSTCNCASIIFMKYFFFTVLDHKTNNLGDPLRDRLNRKNTIPHIVSRPRGLLAIPENASPTGLTSEYLILKPGVLKMGRSYLVQVRIGHSGKYFPVLTIFVQTSACKPANITLFPFSPFLSILLLFYLFIFCKLLLINRS